MIKSLALSLTAALAVAHDVHHHHYVRQATEIPTVVATAGHPSVSTWQDEAAIKDPAQECTGYTYAPVQAIKSQFPPIWTIAQLVEGDVAAAELFLQINATVPANIGVKGTPLGDFSGFSPSYAGKGDPDCWWSYTKCTTPKAANLIPDFYTCPEPNTWGYAFDDGPNCTHNAFYDYLKSQNQLATMFFIGSNVMNWPLEAIRGVQEGHQVCVHTWSHRYLTGLTNEQVFAELYYTTRAIKMVTGFTPTCFRPPFGDVDDRIRTFARGLGLENIMWGYDSNDWRIAQLTKDVIDANYENIINGGLNGTFNTGGVILLTHELNNFTMQEAIDFYPKIQSAFKYIVPIASCMNKTQPYAEASLKYPDFAGYVNARGGNVPVGTDGYSQGTYSNPLDFSATPFDANQAAMFTASTGATPTVAAAGSIPSASGAARQYTVGALALALLLLFSL